LEQGFHARKARLATVSMIIRHTGQTTFGGKVHGTAPPRVAITALSLPFY